MSRLRLNILIFLLITSPISVLPVYATCTPSDLGSIGNDNIVCSTTHQAGAVVRGDEGDDVIDITSGDAPLIQGDGGGAVNGGNDIIYVRAGASASVIRGDNASSTAGNDKFVIHGSVTTLISGDGGAMEVGSIGGNDRFEIYGTLNGGQIKGDALSTVPGVHGGNDTIILYEGASVINADIVGDNVRNAIAGDDIIYIRGNVINGTIAGDQAPGTSSIAGNDFIRIYSTATINRVTGDSTEGQGGNDIIHLEGTANQVQGDDSYGSAGNDNIVIQPNGQVLTGANLPGDVNGDAAHLGGGNDNLFIRGYVQGSVTGDATNGNGGRDSILISGTVDGNVVGDASFPGTTPIGGDLPGGSGGNDSIMLFAIGHVKGAVTGDTVVTNGGRDRIVILGTVDGFILGDDSSAGNGNHDVIVIRPTGTVGNNIHGDDAPGNGGNDSIRLIYGATMNGAFIHGDRVGGNGGHDIIVVRNSGEFGITGDQAGGKGGNDLLYLIAQPGTSVSVTGVIYGDLSDGDGGNDRINIGPNVTHEGVIIGDQTAGNAGDDKITIQGTQIGTILGDGFKSGAQGAGGNDHVQVFGTVFGNVALDTAGSTAKDRLDIFPTGEIMGDVFTQGGGDTIVIQGTLNGNIICTPADNVIILGAGVHNGIRAGGC
ncbi:MAG: hypothetical protein V3V22_05470 [Methylococcales bacterium]